MKNLKKVLLTGTITISTLLAMSVISKAATVQVTADVINIRKEASTDAKVVAMLSKDVECEYLGEDGDWYKVKYKNYTGYVSKQYTKLVEEISDNTESNSEDIDNNKDDSKTDISGNEENNKTTNVKDNQSQEQNNIQSDDSENSETNLLYKKFNKKTIIRILPLIHSSNIGEAKKNDEVLILAETSGWSYIQTDEINGWVRTDTLVESKKETVSQTADDSKKDSKEENKEDTVTTEKIGYISGEYVNVRSGAGTSYSIVEVLELNTQITIIQEQGSWYKVKFGNDTGYISKDYVSDSKTVTNRSLSEPRTTKEETKQDKSKDNTADKTTTSDKKTTTTNKNTTASNKSTNTNKTTASTTNTSTNKTTTNTTTTSTANKNTTTTSKETTKNKNSNTTTVSKEGTTSNNTIKSADIIAYAKKFLGYKYVWGGASTSGFDCSGFTMYVYNHFGVNLPHYTVSQYNSSKGTKIKEQSDLKMGDIVFLTDYETGASCGHCGIYISDGNFIHSDSSVGYVNISNLNGIYKGRFCGALRINNVK